MSADPVPPVAVVAQPWLSFLSLRLLVAAITVVLLCGLATVSTTAHASSPTGKLREIGAGLQSCPKGYFCAWRDIDFRGPGVAFEGSADHWHHLGGRLPFIDDNASSMFNNGRRRAVRVWVNVRYTGANGCFSKGGKVRDLQAIYDDKISSHRWVRSCAGSAPRPAPAPQCVSARQDRYISTRPRHQVDHSYSRLTWEPTFCRQGDRWVTSDEPVLQMLGMGSLTGVGLDFEAARRTSTSVEYRGRIRVCPPFTFSYVGLSYGGPVCWTAGNVVLNAQVRGRTSVRHLASVKTNSNGVALFGAPFEWTKNDV